MATCRDVVTIALRKLGVVSRGRPVPAPFEAQNALEVLQAGYAHLFQEGRFGGWNEYIATADYEAKEFDRIVKSGFTITMPATVTDLVTGCVRPPLDLAPVMVVTSGAAPELHLYDAFAQGWGRCDGLTLDSIAPLSLRNADGLASWLAIAYSDEVGEGQPLARTQAAAGVFVSTITRRPATPQPVRHTFF